MAESEIENRVRLLADKLQEILSKNLLKNHEAPDNEMERAGAIRDQITALGFYVTWEANINPAYQTEIAVTVTVYKVRENLSPELQKIYNDWLIQTALRRNKLNPKKEL